MNKADETRDKIRQMQYLMAEKKFIDDMIHKLDEQKNRLLLEELSIRTMISNQSSNNAQMEDEEIVDNSVKSVNLCSGTPCRPIEEPIVASLQLNDGIKKAKVEAVVQPLELDVRKVLLKLASGGHQDQEEDEEEEDD